MNSIAYIKQHILSLIQDKYNLSENESKSIIISFNQNREFGDLSINAAFIISGLGRGKSTPEIASEIAGALQDPMTDEYENKLAPHIKSVNIMGNGFVNVNLTEETWHTTAHELAVHPTFCFKLFDDEERKNYLIEFVSANPTGPISIAHGRNAILGDTLARVLSFLGHKVTKEFYINDAGQQIKALGKSLHHKLLVKSGKISPHNESELQYNNEYMDDLANKALADFGPDILNKEEKFFATYAKNYFLNHIKEDLANYHVNIENWKSEEELFEQGKIQSILKFFEAQNLTYEQDGALWFKATNYGDEKDRVLVKSDGSCTYLLPDIAYHKDKFDRKYDFIVDILGQDHHGCEKRMLGAMEALGFDSKKLKLLFYQMVMIKEDEKVVRMSKRKGNFKSLKDVVEEVGVDVARFFYLNKKADAHLNFDMELALTASNDNPVYYIQYAYVRTNSILSKASELNTELAEYVDMLLKRSINEVVTASIEHQFYADDIELLKKICSFRYVLIAIAQSYQAHLLANFTLELTKMFHAYYNANRIIDENALDVTRSRLLIISIVRNTLSICLDLLGLSKPDRM